MLRVINFVTFITLKSVWLTWQYVMPEKFSFRLVRGLGLLSYYVMGKYRRLALANLELALGETTAPEERERIAKESFVNMAYSLMEMFFMGKIMKEWKERIEWEGDDLVDELVRQGRGFFVYGGHLGCWTMIAAIPRRFKIPGCNVVVRPLRNPYINEYTNYVFGLFGGKIVTTRKMGAEIVKRTSAGELTGFYLDQESRRKQGIFVEFFGQEACSHVVPGHLAQKYDIPMLPLWIPRISPGRFKVIFKKPITVERTGDEELDDRVMTQALVEEVENTIREYPEQWLWAHNRWKRKTDGSDLEDRKKEQKPKFLRQKDVYLTSKDLRKKARQEAEEEARRQAAIKADDQE